MSTDASNIITTVEQLDGYINWLTKNKVAIQGDRPEFSQEMGQLINLYNQTGRMISQNPEQAIKDFAKMLKRYPMFVAARYNMAHALKSQGRLEEALEHYQITAQHNPNDPAIYIELGDVYYQLEQKGNEIVSYFQALLMASEDDVEIIWKATKNIGQTFGEVREYKKSIRFLHMALDIALEDSKYSVSSEAWNNEFVATYLELGKSYQYSGDFNTAEQMFLKGTEIGAKAKSRSPQLTYHETLIWSATAELYLELEQWKKAEQYAQKCVDRYPNEKVFQLNLTAARNKGK
jgi:tetratricopeptide (TPR) repeat protein